MVMAAGVDADDKLDAAAARQVLRRSARLLRPHRRRVLGAVAMVVLWTATVLAGPYLVSIGIDRGIKEGSAAALNLAVLGYVGVAAVTYATHRRQIAITSWAAEALERVPRTRVVRLPQRLPLPFHNQPQAGVLVSRLPANVASLAGLTQLGLAIFVPYA